MSEKKTIQTPFGELPYENGVISMSNSQLMAEYEKRGLTNAAAVCDALNDVKSKVQKDMIMFAGKQALKTLEPCTFKAGLKANRFEVTVKPEQKITLPGRNGEPAKTDTRYGVVVIKANNKVPSEIFEEQAYKDMCNEFAKKCKAAAPKIKVSA